MSTESSLKDVSIEDYCLCGKLLKLYQHFFSVQESIHSSVFIIYESTLKLLRDLHTCSVKSFYFSVNF